MAIMAMTTRSSIKVNPRRRSAASIDVPPVGRMKKDKDAGTGRMLLEERLDGIELSKSSSTLHKVRIIALPIEHGNYVATKRIDEIWSGSLPRLAVNCLQFIHRCRPRIDPGDALDRVRFLGKRAKLLLLDADVAQALWDADFALQMLDRGHRTLGGGFGAQA